MVFVRLDELLSRYVSEKQMFGDYEYDLAAKIFGASQVFIYLMLSAALVLIFVHAK